MPGIKRQGFGRIPWHEKFIHRDLNRIYPRRLNYLNSIADFIGCVLRAKNTGFEDIVIDFSREDPEDKAYYPNILVPITAFVDNLIQTEGLEFNVENDTRNLTGNGFLNPPSASQMDGYPQVLNVVWRFETGEDVKRLVDGYMDDIYKQEKFDSKQILLWLEWCLNEVMDNVKNHSESQSGFVMGQIHTSSKNIAFCVADAGRGIYKSFRDSSIMWPKDERDALEMALRQGVTRDPNVGQGNGLWGLHEVAAMTNGRLRLGSAGSMLNVDQRGLFIVYPYLNKDQGGTVVDFSFDYSKPVDLRNVLGGHEPESMKVYNASDKKTGAIIYKLIDQRSGFGTRSSVQS